MFNTFFAALWRRYREWRRERRIARILARGAELRDW